MKRRKLLSLLLALCMTFGLTACGGSKTTEESSGDSGSAGESGGDTITIGMIGPLTGSLAVYGTHVQAGVELAIEEINAVGGPAWRRPPCPRCRRPPRRARRRGPRPSSRR